MQYYTSADMYVDKCMESQVCNDCIQWNSLSEVLSEDVGLSIYFHFKVLNTLQNNMSRIFGIVVFIVFPHEKTCLTFSLFDIIKIYLFVFQFKIILNFAHLVMAYLKMTKKLFPTILVCWKKHTQVTANQHIFKSGLNKATCKIFPLVRTQWSLQGITHAQRSWLIDKLRKICMSGILLLLKAIYILIW